MTTRIHGPSDAERRAAVRAAIARRRFEGKTLYPMATQAAPLIGRSASTLYRWSTLSEPPGRPGPKPYVLSDDDIQAVRDHHGCFSAAFREREAAGIGASRSAFIRGCHKTFTRGEIATMREGYAGHKRHLTRMQRTDVLSSNAEWQTDAKKLDFFVTLPGHKRLIRPWVVTVIDVYDRGVRGFCLCPDNPTEADVLAAIYDAVRISPASPLGGIPDSLVTDNGLEFMSNTVTTMLLTLGIVAHATDGHAPEQKGIIERFFRTQIQFWEKQQPQWVDGPRERSGELVDSGQPLTFDEAANRLATFYRSYNDTHKHSSLDGKTPSEVYAAGRTPRIADEVLLRSLLFRRAQKKVTNKGIRHNNLYYLAGRRMDDLVGDKVMIAVPPNQTDYIEVYDREGNHLFRAVRPEALEPTERKHMFRERKQTLTKRMSHVKKEDRRKARRESAERTSGPERRSRRQSGDRTERPEVHDAEAREGLESLGLEVFSSEELLTDPPMTTPEADASEEVTS